MNNKLVVTKKQIKIFFMLLLTKIVYEIVIYLLLPENYLLWSFEKNINWGYLLVEIPVFCIAGVILCINFNDISPLNFFVTMIFELYFIPTNSSLVLSHVEIKYYILSNTFGIFLIIIFRDLVGRDNHKIRNKDSYSVNSKGIFIDNILESSRLWWCVRGICVFTCVATLIYVYMYNGLNLSVIFNEMYTVRSEYAKHALEMTGSLASYLTLIVTRLSGWILPLYLYFALKKGNKLDIIFSLFTFLANFSVEMQKSSLMIVLIVIAIVLIEKKGKIANISIIVIQAFIGLMLFSLAEYFLYGQSVLFTVFVRRLLYIPSYMNEKYYEFFSMNRKIYFTQDAFLIQNILQKVFGRAYTKSSVAVISSACFNGELPSPNTGLFAEAYSQLGILGIFVFPFIYKYIAKIVYKVSHFYGKGAIYVILFKLVLTITSVFTLTSSTFVGILLFLGITLFAKSMSCSFNRR